MPLEMERTAGIAPGAIFDCSEGWRGLISQAAAEVAALPDDWSVRIVGGREKQGGLSLEIWYDGRWPYETVLAFIDDFRAMSLAICEECGRPGRLRSIGGVAKTRCDYHAD